MNPDDTARREEELAELLAACDDALAHGEAPGAADQATGPADQQPFYTMRFVQGRTLCEAVQEYHRKRPRRGGGDLERNALLNAFVSVCHTVAYAHARGVIHRDLKGQNIV